MSWPISGAEGQGKMQKVPVNMLYRWYLYDIVGEDANKNIELFNLSPVSTEGDEKELEDAEKRLIEISSLIPFIKLYSDMNAQYTFEVHKSELKKIGGISDEAVNSGAAGLKEFYSSMTFSGIVALLSAAVELEIIELNGTFTGVKEEEK
jgi:hypothetical protein